MLDYKVNANEGVINFVICFCVTYTVLVINVLKCILREALVA